MFALRRSLVGVPSASTRAFSSSGPLAYVRLNLIGHLAATPEVEATSSGNEIIKFSLATHHGPKDNRHTSWWRVVSFVSEGPRRDFLTSIPKGSLMLVEADARMRQYEDANGKTKTSIEILERHFEVVKSPTQPAQSQ